MVINSRKLDTRGRHQLGFKPNSEQLKRRRLKAVEYYEAGYQVEVIATALGVSKTSIGVDLQAMGFSGKRRGIHRSEFKSDMPPSYDWISTPPPSSTGPAYSRSQTIAMWRNALERSVERRSINALANDAQEALEVQDMQWLAEQAEMFGQIAEYARKLQATLRDHSFRRSALLNQEDAL